MANSHFICFSVFLFSVILRHHFCYLPLFHLHSSPSPLWCSLLCWFVPPLPLFSLALVSLPFMLKFGPFSLHVQQYINNKRQLVIKYIETKQVKDININSKKTMLNPHLSLSVKTDLNWLKGFSLSNFSSFCRLFHFCRTQYIKASFQIAVLAEYYLQGPNSSRT